MPVMSATQAHGRTWPPASEAGVHTRAGIVMMGTNVVRDGEPGRVGREPLRLGVPGLEDVGAAAGLCANQVRCRK